jgi:hypothetical protein
MSKFDYLALAFVYAMAAVLLMQDGHAAHAFLTTSAAAIYAAAHGRHPPKH